jgi:hypothetical protein
MASGHNSIRLAIERNQENFSRESSTLLVSSFQALSADRRLKHCYEVATSIQAWRVSALSSVDDNEAGAFFREAQNDVLLSLVLAAHGLWRPALQSLRSASEGVLTTFYYRDHPVELALWHDGEHKLEFSELLRYYQRHPRFRDLPSRVNPLADLGREYGELSRAVHASSVPYRMTNDQLFPQLSSSDLVSLAKWEKRFTKTLGLVNIFLIAIVGEIEGAANRPLRQVISLALSARQRGAVIAHYRIQLFSYAAL